MPLNATFANDLAKLIFQATAIADIADNDATSPLTNLFFALHTADPGAAGTQTTSECAYTSYARVTVARSGSGFTVTGNIVNPAADVTFPAATGSPNETATHFSVGTLTSGAGKILGRGALSPNIAITSAGVVPKINATTAITLVTT